MLKTNKNKKREGEKKYVLQLFIVFLATLQSRVHTASILYWRRLITSEIQSHGTSPNYEVLFAFLANMYIHKAFNKYSVLDKF